MSSKHSFLPQLIMHAAMTLMAFEIVPAYGLLVSDLFEPVTNAIVMAQRVA